MQTQINYNLFRFRNTKLFTTLLSIPGVCISSDTLLLPEHFSPWKDPKMYLYNDLPTTEILPKIIKSFLFAKCRAKQAYVLHIPHIHAVLLSALCQEHVLSAHLCHFSACMGGTLKACRGWIGGGGLTWIDSSVFIYKTEIHLASEDYDSTFNTWLHEFIN